MVPQKAKPRIITIPQLSVRQLRMSDRHMQSIHTVEHYSAVTRRKVLTEATTWMEPEDTEQQSRKDRFCMTALLLGTQRREIQRQEVDQRLLEAGGGEGRRVIV